jgi:hypothetical protein
MLIVCSSIAKADQLQFTLSVSGCTGGCYVPAGTVTLTQDAAAVDVRVDLTQPASGFGTGFIDTGGNGKSNSHTTFVFNIAGQPSITISNLSTGFAYPADTNGDSPFGTFGYGIDCITCGNGASNPTPPPLLFTVGLTSGSLSINNFTGNANGYYFAADIFSAQTGNTGAVAAPGPGVAVPEPSSLALFGFGLFAATGVIRKKILQF